MLSRRCIILVFILGFACAGCALFGEYDEELDPAKLLLRNRSLMTENLYLTTQGEQQQKEINLLKKQLEEKQASIEQLQAQITALNAEVAVKKQLEEQLAAANQKLAEITEQFNALKSRLSAVEKESATYLEMAKKMESEIKKGTISLRQSGDRIILNVSDKILFDSGKTEVKQEGLEVLERVAEVIKKATDKEVRIEGHTDNAKISGRLKEKYPTNWELSAARATNVARYLVEKGGLDPANIYAAGYGEYRPIVPNDTPEGKAKNRRIEITLLPKESEAASPPQPANQVEQK